MEIQLPPGLKLWPGYPRNWYLVCIPDTGMSHFVTIKRDLVCQGHVTLNVIFFISGSSDAKAMICICLANL